MALITRIGGRESNSFVTVSEADTIIQNLPDDTTEWDDLEEVQKELRLRMGAQLMATMNLAGRRVYCGQALCFPRTNQANRYVIPNEVKETQVFMAYSVIHRALANRPGITEEAAGNRVTRVSLGGLLSVGFSGEPITAGTALDAMVRSTQFPAYLLMQRYLTQVRGGSVEDADEVTCSTTTTTTSTTSTTVTTTTVTTTTMTTTTTTT